MRATEIDVSPPAFLPPCSTHPQVRQEVILSHTGRLLYGDTPLARGSTDQPSSSESFSGSSLPLLLGILAYRAFDVGPQALAMVDDG